MRHLVRLVVLVSLGGCASGPTLIQRGPKPDANVESQYVRALAHLDPANKDGTIEAAVVFLDAYLAHAGYIERRAEAAALRRLAGRAMQLAKVEAALQQARANTANTANTAKSGEPARSGDDDSIKEIQRLKEELAEANAELERIRKRLATPKP